MKLNTYCSVFDPATPERLVTVDNVAFDNWFYLAAITRKVFTSLKYVPESSKEKFNLSSGMMVELPIVEIGIRIGPLKFEKVKAYVVEEGEYDLIIGKDLISNIFSIGTDEEQSTSFVSYEKEDKEAFSLRLHALNGNYYVYNFEKFLYNQRRLYNILLIVNNEIIVNSKEEAAQAIEHDKNIPEDKLLKITWIENGSIWITLKSAALSLKSLGKIFGEAKLSELKKNFYEAEINKTESEILKETRNEIIITKNQEQRKFRAENIHEENNIWRKEFRERIKFHKELTEEINNPEVKKEVQQKMDEAIAGLLDQNLLPETIQLPNSEIYKNDTDNGRFLLPMSTRKK